MRKRVICLFIIFTLLFGSSLAVFALQGAQAESSSDVPFEEGINEELEEIQELEICKQYSDFLCELSGLSEEEVINVYYDRLMDLADMMMDTESSIILPFMADGTVIPHINFIAPPANMREPFLIGLYIDYGDLSYSDKDALAELTSRPPPQEAIDFILNFTGIPHEMASFGFSVFMRTPLRNPSDRIEGRICPVWGESISVDQVNNNAPTIVKMGQMIYFDGPFQSGDATIGHPLDIQDKFFMTATHSNAIGHLVFFLQDDVLLGKIGTVTMSLIDLVKDITIVMLDAGHQISNELPSGWQWPAGNLITNYTGTPSVQNVVRSIRGMSGVQQSTISHVNASFPGSFQNKIMIFPDGNSTDGDSGAALIRMMDSAVLGTRAGYTFFNGEIRGVYTDVRNYGF